LAKSSFEKGVEATFFGLVLIGVAIALFTVFVILPIKMIIDGPAIGGYCILTMWIVPLLGGLFNHLRSKYKSNK
tara:strand:- start:32568 stop:32789 length:222 start_codon:yes stop_codon:yes gene_type:complete